MKKSIASVLLTLALALTGVSAVAAQDAEPSPEPGTLEYGPFETQEQRQAAIVAYLDFRDELIGLGFVDDAVAGSVDWATDWLQNWYGQFGPGSE